MARPLRPEQRIGQTLCGKWTLTSLLGFGGMGAVYLGEHEIGHQVAIKMLHPDLAVDPSLRGRFEREARAVNRFRHVGAVEIRDIDKTEEGTPFLVMEFLKGQSLADLIRAESTIELDVLLDWTDQLLDVLAAAHEQQIVHRDIKPDNLFITEKGRLKVLDFGIAQMRHGVSRSRYTMEGDVLGTVAYMPPEQVDGSNIDHRADLFAVGATMFRVIAGRPVHQVDASTRGLLIMATEPAPPLSEVAPQTPADVCAVVDRALAFYRDDRYPDAPSMQGDVQAVRQGRAPPYVSAHPTRRRIRLGGFAAVTPSSESEAVRAATLPTRVEAHAAKAEDDALAAEQLAGSETDEPAKATSGQEPTDDETQDIVERLVGTTLGGRYRVVGPIGLGGMGAVLEAHDEQGQQWAIKVIISDPQRKAKTRRERFRREARATATIDSPHVVKVVDADVDEGTGIPYLVMELLPGEDLAGRLARGNPLAPVAVARLFSQACRGVAAAHGLDIVHRDIKPGNIFLSCPADSEEITVKICDFGLAKDFSPNRDESSVTKSGSVLGTPRYVSPEQVVDAKNVTVQADLWALCLSMYEALSGPPPWLECESTGALLVAICTQDLPALAQVAPWVDHRLAAVVDRGLRRELDERWSTMDELIAALEPFIGGEETLTKSLLALRPDTQSKAAATTLALGPSPEAEPEQAPADSVMQTAASQPPRKGQRWVMAGVAALIGTAIAVFAFTQSPDDSARASDDDTASSVRATNGPARLNSAEIPNSAARADTTVAETSSDPLRAGGGATAATKLSSTRHGSEPPVSTTATASRLSTTAPATGSAVPAPSSAKPIANPPSAPTTGTSTVTIPSKPAPPDADIIRTWDDPE